MSSSSSPSSNRTSEFPSLPRIEASNLTQVVLAGTERAEDDEDDYLPAQSTTFNLPHFYARVPNPELWYANFAKGGGGGGNYLREERIWHWSGIGFPKKF